jgi:hypothetical protein
MSDIERADPPVNSESFLERRMILSYVEQLKEKQERLEDYEDALGVTCGLILILCIVVIVLMVLLFA